MNRRTTGKSNRSDQRAGKRVNASEVVQRRDSEVIIDGYNLMHVTRFKPIGSAPGELKRCREAMLSFLAKEVAATAFRKLTVVFDSEHAPKGLPDSILWRHIHVLFAVRENSADDLIASLIQQQPNPRRLVVVSSDHRVHVAAQRRRATAIDSDVWFDAIVDRQENAKPLATNAVDDLPPLSAKEHQEFVDAMNKHEPIRDHNEKDEVKKKGEPEERQKFENPFPDGYFDDLDEL